MKKTRARRMTGHCVLTETDSTFTDSKVEIPCTGEVISGKMTGGDIIAVEGRYIRRVFQRNWSVVYFGGNVKLNQITYTLDTKQVAISECWDVYAAVTVLSRALMRL